MPKDDLVRPMPQPKMTPWVLAAFLIIAGYTAYEYTGGDFSGVDSAGLLGRILGAALIPMVLGMMGLFLRRWRGPAFFVIAVGFFAAAGVGRMIGGF